jgi:hypothetical protein
LNTSRSSVIIDSLIWAFCSKPNNHGLQEPRGASESPRETAPYRLKIKLGCPGPTIGFNETLGQRVPTRADNVPQ